MVLIQYFHQVFNGVSWSKMRRMIALVSVCALASCQQIQTPSDLLFAPTFSQSREQFPYTANTPYDCRTFSGSGWKGIAGGTVSDFGDRYPVAQTGCFKTRQESEAYLNIMRSYITTQTFIGCRPHTA
ncbi:hypothetical protein E1180_11360 [Roseibium denhamense]|uniref:hypothetical protein n=1 Tax=Roseibium denhamense TaxID=76305 RepID=UPI0012BCAB2C|nr:hypothetical protein [Roseibium denhamense]MTI06110.1 hypothetical protein [Roseibium denhamense]